MEENLTSVLVLIAADSSANEKVIYKWKHWPRSSATITQFTSTDVNGAISVYTIWWSGPLDFFAQNSAINALCFNPEHSS